MIKKVSKDDNVSINQFIASAVTEKITALETENYLQTRAARGSRKAFSEILSKVPDAPADSADR
jgi:hypothetical protein